jgi:hypothetical protein
MKEYLRSVYRDVGNSFTGNRFGFPVFLITVVLSLLSKSNNSLECISNGFNLLVIGVVILYVIYSFIQNNPKVIQKKFNLNDSEFKVLKLISAEMKITGNRQPVYRTERWESVFGKNINFQEIRNSKYLTISPALANAEALTTSEEGHKLLVDNPNKF